MMEMERDYLMDVLIRTGAVCSCFEVNEHPEIEAMPHIKKISNILPGARKELMTLRTRNAELEAEVGRLREALTNIPTQMHLAKEHDFWAGMDSLVEEIKEIEEALSRSGDNKHEGVIK